MPRVKLISPGACCLLLVFGFVFQAHASPTIVIFNNFGPGYTASDHIRSAVVGPAVDVGTPFIDGGGTWNPVNVIATTLGAFDVLGVGVPSTIPEPASMILFGIGLVMVGGILRRRRSKSNPSA